jgi:hypothetical protein
VDEALWQLGSFADAGHRWECFFIRYGPLSEREHQRILAFRNALVLRGKSQQNVIDGFRGTCFSLIELLEQHRQSLKVTDLRTLLWKRAVIRFDEASGSVFAGDIFLGEAPVGSKEHHLLATLSAQQDRFVGYADIKHEILRRTGSADTTDEATFCHKLKNRLKQRIPEIDSLIATTNKGDGFRLRAHLPREA